MKIVVLDGYAANPGDLDWSELKSLGDTIINDRTPAQNITDVAKDAEILIGNKAILSKDILSKLTKLKYIGLLSTGYNVVDLEYCRANNIPVCNVPAYSTEAVAQHTFSLLLEVCSHVGMHSESVHNGVWSKKEDFCYWLNDIIELTGKTFGIIGFGSIGKATAKIANAFGMKVIAYSRHAFNAPRYVKRTSLEKVLSSSDVLSLHCPLNEESNCLINKHTISLMKNDCIIINTARGGLVDELAVKEALDNKKLRAFCADVLSTEPPSINNPLIMVPNVYITPHIAWASVSARTKLLRIVCQNIRDFINGNELINDVTKL